MDQTTTQELRVTLNTDTGKTVQITVPDANLDEVTSDTAIAIFTAASAPLTGDSTKTLVNSTDGGNVINLKEAYVINSVKTYIIKNYDDDEVNEAG